MVNLWPLTGAFNTRTLKQLTSDLDQISIADVMPHTIECQSCQISFTANVAQYSSTAAKDFKGLCLDCVRHSKGEEGRGECRIPHEGSWGISQTIV